MEITKKEILVDVDTMKAEIDLMKNATYTVREGELFLVDTPPRGFGDQIIKWQNGKPEIAELSFKTKLGAK